MAKELPYFKFFCSEWTDGDITLEDMEAQGVFINVCSYYWSNNCTVELSKLKKRFRSNIPSLDLIIEADIIKIKDGFIIINFLDEQLAERSKLANQNRLNAQKRWKEKREECERNANASDSQSQSDAIKKRGEERRKEEKREENKEKETRFNFRKSLEDYGFKSDLVDEWIRIRKAKKAVNSEHAFKKIITEVEKTGKPPNEVLKIAVDKQWKGIEAEWIKNLGYGSTTDRGINKSTEGKDRVATDFSNNGGFG